MGDNLGASAGAAAGGMFDGKLLAWPKNSLSVCNVPTDQKAFIRYYACEWMKNQPVGGNSRYLAQQAIQSAQTLYSELSSRGYMNS